jgi:putative flippase GtrA
MVTALAGFASNELMFVLLLRGLGMPPMLALFVALVFAAGQTFVLSRFWAFRR